MLPTKREAAAELLRRREARRQLAAYIGYTSPKYKQSAFSDTVCAALDEFVKDVMDGKRPIVVLQAPPQHGKSEIVSRKLPAYLMGKYPDLRIGAASYSDALAGTMAQDVRRTLASDEHNRIFAPSQSREKDPYKLNRIGEFTSPYGLGSYIGVGVGAGLTGRPLDIGIIDDPIKNQQEALSETSKASQWDWYQSVFTTRLSEKSGQIIMATSWADDDLPARICQHFAGNPRLTVLKFPAINEEGEAGFNPDLPRGALAPEIKSLDFLREVKGLFSEYWWAAMYQQSPRPAGGAIFKHEGIRTYTPQTLPARFDKVIQSWDCTFKDSDGSDFVVGQVWGKNEVSTYLLDQVRARMSFTQTVAEIIKLSDKWPQCREVLIEDKANGSAVIDTLKKTISGIIPVEPDGSKLARAHAITSYWEAGNIYTPDPAIYPWAKEFIGEVTAFPTAAHDDQVDAMTQAVRRLYPAFNRLAIRQDVINRAMGRIL